MDYSKKLLLFIIILLGIIAAAHATAFYYFLYWRLWWLDIVIHFLGGVWLGSVMAWILFFSKFSQKISALPCFLLFIIVGVSVLGGVFWEFSEFLCDYFFVGENSSFLLQTGVADTMSDLFFDALGGFAVGFASIKFLSKENKNYEPK